jgi:hypothetical protein
MKLTSATMLKKAAIHEATFDQYSVVQAKKIHFLWVTDSTFDRLGVAFP